MTLSQDPAGQLAARDNTIGPINMGGNKKKEWGSVIVVEGKV
jgi:hypothetical protein